MSRLITALEDLHRERRAAHGRVALVPTMGALHDGHLALVARARELADHVIVSNFVNPLQFGPGEDYERYPRTPEADLALLDGRAEAMFAPSVQEMYPHTPPFQIDVGPLGEVFEGAIRPGHFSGVATVVLHLLTLTRPDVAIFGEKDAQQLAIIRRLVRDFHVPTEIVAVPIVREPSGLARSSRNVYLDAHGREVALGLYATVRAASAARTAPELRAALERFPGSEEFTWDYREAVDPATLTPIRDDFAGEALVLLAARVQGVRLIDNVRVRVA
ncbi:MAG: pantoate--beta-alanine ligase [Dermabacter sp.]|nr:pantoate--beta-alanine ligase [Dermabacter sp.]